MNPVFKKSYFIKNWFLSVPRVFFTNVFFGKEISMYVCMYLVYFALISDCFLFRLFWARFWPNFSSRLATTAPEFTAIDQIKCHSFANFLIPLLGEEIGDVLPSFFEMIFFSLENRRFLF